MNFRDNNSINDNRSKKIKSKLDYYDQLQKGIRPEYESAKIILIYILIGSMWIIFSDRILINVVGNIRLYQRMQTFKGWFYVILS